MRINTCLSIPNFPQEGEGATCEACDFFLVEIQISGKITCLASEPPKIEDFYFPTNLYNAEEILILSTPKLKWDLHKPKSIHVT